MDEGKDRSTSANVELGKDGWLFYIPENNIKITAGTYPDFGEDKLVLYCQELTQVNEKLKEQGRDFVFVLPPSKAGIYPEYIQTVDYAARRTPADELADYLERNAKIRVVRLKDALLKEKKETDELLYYKTDTHWNIRGRYIGYRRIIEDMNRWRLLKSEPFEAEFHVSGPFSGDLSAMLGAINFNGDLFAEDKHEEIELKKYHVQRVNGGERYEEFISLINEEGINPEKTSMWINPENQDAPRLLVYGDSMIGGCIINWLAGNFSETTFIWTYGLNQEMIDWIDPDIVILDISERGLNSVLPGALDSFLEK